MEHRDGIDVRSLIKPNAHRVADGSNGSVRVRQWRGSAIGGRCVPRGSPAYFFFQA
jgi:hypothetical protein